MFEFKAPPSNFYGQDRKRAKYGDWFAPYYGYVDIENKRWLIISDEQHPIIDGRQFDLTYREPLMNVKGMAGLEKPGTYKLWYKSL